MAIANHNRCEPCLAAHTVLGQNAGASPDEMAAAQVSDGDVAQLHEVGFKDEQVVEILAHVALNLYTNDINVTLK